MFETLHLNRTGNPFAKARREAKPEKQQEMR
jgi:hypothetical protein